MHKRALSCLAFASLLLPAAALALELVAPAPDCVLRDGRVLVVGKAAKADKGKVDFDGKATSFRIKDGTFTVALDLGPGAHEVRFTAGDETLVTKWQVDPAAKAGFYTYHPSIKSAACKDCHDEGTPLLNAAENVSAVCRRCHPAYDDKFVHGPVAMGLCAACHNSHGAVTPHLLRMSTEDLCADCHNQPITEKHSKNEGGECLGCHNPHSSQKQFLAR